MSPANPASHPDARQARRSARPFYAWFIKRDPQTGARTHHIHMVEEDLADHWDRLLFRDYLTEHPEVAREYERLKAQLASASPQDRVALSRGKTAFVVKATEQAKQYYGKASQLHAAEAAARRL